MTFESVVDKLVALFDVTQVAAVDVVNDRLQDMVTRSTALRAVKSLGTTVALTASYTLDPTVVKVLKVWIVNGTETTVYEGKATLEDFVDLVSGDSITDGHWYATEPDSDSLVTTENLRLWPVPSVSALTITGLAAIRPAVLTYATATALPIPTDVHRDLLEGCKAVLYAEEGRGDEAQVPDMKYEKGIKDLLAGVEKRGKGSTGTRLRMAGYDFSRR